MQRFKTVFIQLVRFSMVGTTCFFIDYFLMIFLTEFTAMSYFVASAVSFIVSTVINYVLSMRFVFKGKEGMSRLKELSIFVLLSIVGLGLNQMIMWIVVEKFHIYYMIAKIMTAIIVSAYSFVSRKAILE